MIKKLTYACFMVLLFFSAHAQKETNIWYFGNKAGLDFNSGTPMALTNSSMTHGEGCSTVCNESGNLLFYTDGDTVWNKNHSIMTNGTGLYGNSSSTQSAIIIKKPGNNALYYIFTTDAIENNLSRGFNYSIIDIEQNSGNGNVISKNNLLYNTVPEKVTAVVHANGMDIWIITHEWNSISFRAYLLTESGLNSIENSTSGYPVISATGSYHGNIIWDAAGQLKASPSGNKIAVAIYFTKFELFDFDKSSGQLSNPTEIICPIDIRQYGIEFSPDESKIYLSKAVSPSYLYQVDLSKNIKEGNKGSSYLLGTSIGAHEYGGLQTGPDGKIYVALKSMPYLGVIHNPNESGAACNFIDKDLYLANRKSVLGLPYSITSSSSLDFYFSNQCYTDSTWFTISNTYGIDSVLWNFNDPASGLQNNSNQFYPYHIFTASGNYTISLTYYTSGNPTSITNEVTIYPLPDINLGNDTIICTGEALILNPSGDFQSYLWQDNSTEPNFTISENGLYWVEVENEFGCFNRDSVNVTIALGPEIWLGNDSTFCTGDTIMLCAGNGYPDYLWQDGSTDSCLTVTTSGNYWVEVGDEFGCMGYDTINLAFLPGPNVSLGNDTLICSNEYCNLTRVTATQTIFGRMVLADKLTLLPKQGNIG